MKRYLKIFGALITVVAIASLIGVISVAADAPDDAPVRKWGGWGGSQMMGWGGHMGRWPGRLGMPEEMLAIAADVLGVEPAELEELLEDKTLFEIIEETDGVEMEDIHDAMMEAHQAEAREAIETNEDLDEDHKEWLLQGLDNGWGFGYGMRAGSRGGYGIRGGPRGGLRPGSRFSRGFQNPTAFGCGMY